MRHLAIFLLLAASVTATSQTFTLYTGDVASFDDMNFSFSLSLGASEGLATAAKAYSDVKGTDDLEALEEAYDELQDALADAKADDRLFVKTPWNSLIIEYQTCEDIENHAICFTGSTYYEEDVNPLGDNKFDTVKLVNGTILTPFTVSISTTEAQVTASRMTIPATVYVGETVTTTITVVNSGTAPSGRVSIEDYSPLPVVEGDTMLTRGSLPVGGTAQMVYTSLATAPGTYTFVPKTSLSLGNGTVTVKTPVNITVSANASYEDSPAEIRVTIENLYDEELTIELLSITADDPFLVLPEGEGRKVNEHEKQFDKFTIAPGESFTTNGTVLPITPGERDVNVRVRYFAVERVNEQRGVMFSALPREFTVTPVFSAGTAIIVLNNTLQETVKDIAIVYSDGYEQVRTLKPESAAAVKRVFEQAGTAEGTVFYTLSGEKHSVAFKGEVNPAAPVTEEVPVVEEPLAQPEELPAPAAEPVAAPQAQPATPAEDERGIVKRFLDFLENLFS